MDTARIAELLAPYLGVENLAPAQLAQISIYIDLLLKWNARMNLTSVRAPEQIVTRHFGEALFAARHLFPDPATEGSLADVGSGAGFPGLPIAIARPSLGVTLIEAHGKKAVFLKECVRSTGVSHVRVLNSRAEDCAERFDVVTFRAVEHFEGILPISAALVKRTGRLAALLGPTQAEAAKRLMSEGWLSPATVYFPGSSQQALWIAAKADI
jgi:16S rRNA (guanine527-N7)-methyltransferase